MTINIKPSHKGKLHRALGIPIGQKIPVAKVKKAEGSASPALRKEAQFADNARNFGHKKQTVTPVATDRGSFGIKG